MSIYLVLSLAAAPAATALPVADSADGRCIVLLGYVGSRGTSEQAAATQKMIPYFLGRLSARHPDSMIAGIVARAADEARTGQINAQREGARCQAAFSATGAAFTGGLRTAIGQSDLVTPHTP